MQIKPKKDKLYLFFKKYYYNIIMGEKKQKVSHFQRRKARGEQHNKYRVVLLINGKYKSTLSRHYTRESAFNRFRKVKDSNNNIVYPIKHITGDELKKVQYTLVVTKITEEGDKFRLLRDSTGKVYEEAPLGDWTILDSCDYYLEEKFWRYSTGHINRFTCMDVVESILNIKEKTTVTLIVFKNKLVIYNENYFDMIICKCLEDAQRLHHTLYKLCKKHRAKGLLFMGTATKFVSREIHQLIVDRTGWRWGKVKQPMSRHI